MTMSSGIDGSGLRLTAWNHVRAVLLLPAMNTLFIPALLLALFRDARLGSASGILEAAAIGFALPLIGAGLWLVVRAISLFVNRGRGTLAPWDPTATLITSDIYRFSRNPMKAGLFLVLIGESILLRSTAVAIWALAFIAVNVAYIRCFEEPGLRRRFGEAYEEYCRQAPRWLRLRAAAAADVALIERAS